MAVLAAVQAALLYAAVRSSPAVLAPAHLSLGLQSPVTSTARDTLAGGRVQLATLCPQPALLADTHTGDAVAVAGALGVSTVRLLTELSLVSLHTHALPVLAVSVSAAVRDLALLVSDVALLPLPAGLADTLSSTVLSLAAAEERTNGEKTGLALISRLAVTLPRHTLPPPVTILTALGAHLLPATSEQLHAVRGPVIIIQRHEPVAFLQVQLLLPLH